MAPEIGGEEIPSLILQPLVENALKHGLAPKPGRATCGSPRAPKAGRLPCEWRTMAWACGAAPRRAWA